MNLDLLKIELRLNYKKYLWWTFAWILTFMLLYAFFDSLKENADELGPLLEAFGESGEVFYASTEAFTTIRGYFNGEAYTFYLLVAAIFGGFIGTGIIGGEIRDKKLSFVLSRQISRFSILNSKIVAHIILLFLTSVFLAFSNQLIVEIMTSGDDHSLLFFFYSFVGAFFINLFFVILGLLIGIFSKSGGFITAGVGFVTWIVNLIAEISEDAENLRYFTPFYYFDMREVIDNTQIDIRQLLPLIAVTIVIYLISIWKFYKTDVRG